MIHLRVAFIDGSCIEKTFPNHEIESIELMIEGTPKALLCRVEVEDHRQTIIYSYAKETDYAY